MVARGTWRSYCDQLAQELQDIQALMLELLYHSTIPHVDPNRGECAAPLQAAEAEL